MTRILVVDDEPAIADALVYALQGEGDDVRAEREGEAALAAARAEPFDAIVLDVMLPGLSGIEICRRLRAESDVPVLLLTARDAEVDRVVGLDAGADDYVTKPFSVAELTARVRSILRRRELDRGGAAVRRVGGLELDPVRHEARVAGTVVDLTPSEYRLLDLLAGQPGRVFSRREILQRLQNTSYVADERLCDTHVANLRRKIGRERLETVRGAGYRLVAM